MSTCFEVLDRRCVASLSCNSELPDMERGAVSRVAVFCLHLIKLDASSLFFFSPLFWTEKKKEIVCYPSGPTPH